MSKIRVGIINVTGYAGMELARLLHQHPGVQLTAVSARSAAGQKLSDALPHLDPFPLPITADVEDADLVFSAMPHRASAEALLPLLNQGAKAVDISADFRLKDLQEYEQWYEVTHPAPALLQEAVYGLPELHRKEVASARLVANPGCYPTAAILALAPLVKEKLIQPDIIIDAKSGISGAGRTLSLNTHYSEANESVSAYALGGHRHLPEISQELKSQGSGFSPSITFLPHLIPMTRGILCSCYARPIEGKIPRGKQGKKKLLELYRDFYRGEPFVRVVDFSPQTKLTMGNNFCIIHPTLDERTGRVIVLSCLDNLIKGAAGQAIQNMNLMLRFPETTGLEALALYP